MSIEPEHSPSAHPDRNPSWQTFVRKAGVVGLFVIFVYLFMVAINLMGTSFGFLEENPAFLGFFKDTLSNPFLALFMGLLSTAILQSSSTTTSVIVILAAGLGDVSDPQTLATVVPMILGANIGTAVTSTIVALGHISSKEEYRRAISAASAHDFFNIFSVLIILPLEMVFGILSRPATALAATIPTQSEGGFFSLMNGGVTPVTHQIHSWGEQFIPANALPGISILLGILLFFLSLRGIIYLVRKNFAGRDNKRVNNALFGNPLKSMGWGFGITALLQSSSVTTSLTVPIVATGKASLSNVFPFLMGANIGTTLTALLAAILVSGKSPQTGLAVAFIHLIFNLYGVLIFFPFRKLRNIPVKLAVNLGNATYKNRLVGIFYIVCIFFLLPFALIMTSRGLQPTQQAAEASVPKQVVENHPPAVPVGQPLDKVGKYVPSKP